MRIFVDWIGMPLPFVQVGEAVAIIVLRQDGLVR